MVATEHNRKSAIAEFLVKKRCIAKDEVDTAKCIVASELSGPLAIIDGHSQFCSKTGIWLSYCQISTNLDKILHTPIVVQNTLVGQLRPRSAHGRLQTKPRRLCFCNTCNAP